MKKLIGIFLAIALINSVSQAESVGDKIAGWFDVKGHKERLSQAEQKLRSCSQLKCKKEYQALLASRKPQIFEAGGIISTIQVPGDKEVAQYQVCQKRVCSKEYVARERAYQKAKDSLAGLTVEKNKY